MIKNRTIFTGDNLPILRGMANESVDLVYLDPPFNSNRTYEAPIGSEAAGAAFKDAWTFNDTDSAWWGEIADEHPALYRAIDAAGTADTGGKAYLVYIAMRLIELRRILKSTGSIYLHCDPTMSHYLKLAMDAVFGNDNFRNEIIWSYRTGGTSNKYFSKKHDILLFYSKENTYVFNPQKEKAYTKSQSRKAGVVNYGAGVAEFFKDNDGVYNMVNMRDVWDIPYINSQAVERTGYPTQKPLALLRCIIKASSARGDMVLDPFCGCATACIAAEDEKRQWTGIDISDLSFDLIRQRTEKGLGMFGLDIIHRTDIPKDRDGRRSKNIKHKLFGEQEGMCNGCRRVFPFQNFTIDHIVPTSAGGTHADENLQLLCNWCNSKKGKRSMESLIAELKREGIRQ